MEAERFGMGQMQKRLSYVHIELTTIGYKREPLNQIHTLKFTTRNRRNKSFYIFLIKGLAFIERVFFIFYSIFT